MTRLQTHATRLALATAALLLANCTSTNTVARQEIRVSVRDQKLALYEKGEPVRVYGVSTSKFGTGDTRNTNRTPIGKLRVAQKIGNGRAPGTVFKGRNATGEIIRPGSTTSRDPIVTRIMWLSGSEGKTRNAYERYIYIHGTPQENLIGQPASYGCVRMRSMDIVDLYSRTSVGTPVRIDRGTLPSAARSMTEYVYTPVQKPTLKTFGPIGDQTGVLVKR